MPDQSLIEQIALALKSAQEQKHRQRFYGAINAFVQAEQLIIKQLPDQLRDEANQPSGLPEIRRAAIGQALLDSGARLELMRTLPSSPVQSKQPEETASINGVPVSGAGTSEVDQTSTNITSTAAQFAEDWTALNPTAPPLTLSTALVETVSSARNALSASLENLSVSALSARLEPKDIPVNLAPFYFADIPLGIGDCLVQLGQDYDRALAYYARAEGYPFTNPPFETRDLWLRLAEAYLARGDAAYRAGDRTKAVQNYEMIVQRGDAPADSRLYKGMLGGMAVRVRAWLRALPTDPVTQPLADYPPRHIAAVAMVVQRLAQIAGGVDFLGETADSRPIYSFSYLREIARGYAQFAAQANREYVAFTQRAEDQTQTSRQLEQAVALADAGLDIELTRKREVIAEIAASEAAERLASDRAMLAADNADHFRRVGWEMAQLDAASAWAGAAAIPKSEEIRQSYRGLDDLGVSGAQQFRSDLVHLLAWQRSTRSYSVEVRRLENAVDELRSAQAAAAAQTVVAQTRAGTADAGIRAARWRGHFARVNLADAQARETSAELYFELGNLVRETARIYLQRAIGAASAMERAYNFENNAEVKRIRLDYGDLSGAGNLYAADFLLRDIDAFLYDHITSTRSKSQLVIRRLSLRRDFPLQFLAFLKSGTAIFQTTLDQFHQDMPGSFNGRIKRVGLEFLGIQSGNGIQGQLTCAGVSSVRLADGGALQKVHPTETMIISPLQPEKSFARLDAGALTGIAPAGELAMFENVGLQCSWRLDIPLRSNDVRMTEFSDVGIVIAYLCQHNPTLETRDLASLPTSGEAELAVGLQGSGRDEAGQETLGQLAVHGESKFVIPADWMPRNFSKTRIVAISLICVDRSGRPIALNLKFWTPTRGDPGRLYTPAADAVTRVEQESQPGAFHNEAVPGVYNVAVKAADNPSLRSTKPGQELDLSSIYDITVLFSYQHEFR